MRYEIVIFLSLALSLYILVLTKFFPITSTIESTVITDTVPDFDWDCLIEAFILQESSGITDAIGDNGKAVGCLQLHPIMVAEANRISHSSYTLEDRLSRTKSIEMFNIVQSHHNPSKDPIIACKVWNPTAPTSYSKSVVNKYQSIYNKKYHIE